mgnify:CR=1 FL=1
MITDTKPWNIIQQLESDNSRLFKEQVVSEHLTNREFLWGLRVGLDSMITFGVKDIPISTEDGPGLTLPEFESLTSDLADRVLSGNAAKDAIESTMNKATSEEWNDWYRRILIKDLRCGVTHKTINKHSDNKVPVFECMLATDSAKHEKKMIGEVLVEPKLDGVRVVVICDVDKNEVNMFKERICNYSKTLKMS